MSSVNGSMFERTPEGNWISHHSENTKLYRSVRISNKLVNETTTAGDILEACIGAFPIPSSCDCYAISTDQEDLVSPGLIVDGHELHALNHNGHGLWDMGISPPNAGKRLTLPNLVAAICALDDPQNQKGRKKAKWNGRKRNLQSFLDKSVIVSAELRSSVTVPNIREPQFDQTDQDDWKANHRIDKRPWDEIHISHLLVNADTPAESIWETVGKSNQLLLPHRCSLYRISGDLWQTISCGIVIEEYQVHTICHKANELLAPKWHIKVTPPPHAEVLVGDLIDAIRKAADPLNREVKVDDIILESKAIVVSDDLAHLINAITKDLAKVSAKN